MARYSFEDDGEDISYHPPSQQTNRPPPQGYTVSNPAAFLPDMSRPRSHSPASSSDSPPHRMVGQNQDQQYERGGYGIPMQETSPARTSAYRRQRQEEVAQLNSSPPRSRAPAAVAMAQTQPDYNMQIPQPHNHPRSLSPGPSPPIQARYTDRSPSRERNTYAPGPYTSSSERHDPFGDPFSTPRQSHTTLPGIAGAAAAGTRHSAYADPAAANFRNRDNYGDIDPTGIDDDDDDPFSTLQSKQGKHKSGGPAAGIAGGAAVAAGAAGFLGSLNPASRDSSGKYGAVPGGSDGNSKGERSEWLSKQATGNKRLKWIVFGLIGLVILLAIIGGVIGVVVSRKTSGNSSASDNGPNLTKDSPTIKALMNNKNYHKVFPGMDYTPLNTLYPACLTTPPTQNHITQDLAVISQLTPVIRLYGTDCNVTDLVLAAIDALDLKNDLKVWAGVFLNDTTQNDRQLQQWWDVLDKKGPDYFQGVIVGNEVTFNKFMTESQLIDVLDEARTNLTAHNAPNLKLATSALGSQWTAELAKAVDIVMSNVHPLFGGVEASQGAAWTWNYWQTNDVILTGTEKDQVIAEVGWPSGGGNYCTTENGAEIACSSSTAGAVAGIDEMNTFLDTWVCQALSNGTQYFWFEMLDEPWKVVYNKPGMEFEDKWGLLDSNRNLKQGVTIPSCGGKIASVPSL